MINEQGRGEVGLDSAPDGSFNLQPATFLEFGA